MASSCRNNDKGFHQAGPPDARGHYFCIHCGQPLLLVEDDNLVGNGCLVITLVAIIAGVITAIFLA
jgi:hypothetical protein